jgi:hypothetical protein
MAEFVTLYGPYLALILVFASWVGKNVWPVLVKREEAEREERRQERAQLIDIVQKNTEAFTRNTDAVEHLSDTLLEIKQAVGDLSTDVTVIYTHLQLSRPERTDKKLVVLSTDKN